MWVILEPKDDFAHGFLSGYFGIQTKHFQNEQMQRGYDYFKDTDPQDLFQTLTDMINDGDITMKNEKGF